MKMKVPTAALCLLLFALILSSCQIPQSIRSFTEKAADLFPVLEKVTELTAESQPALPENINQPPCAYMWASQPLPQLSQEIENLLSQAGLKEIQVNAEAYGENCITENGEIVRFIALQTDIRLIVPVQNLSDPMEMGNIARQLLGVILEIPLSDLPGMQPGYIGIQFYNNEEDVLNLWFKRELSEQLVKAGIKGEELLQELQKK